MRSLDLLSDYQHGYDGVVEALTVQLDRETTKLTARVVLKVVRIADGVERWFRVDIHFSEVEKVQLRPDWLGGGGAVLYDGAKLDWDAGSRRGRLNLDPGVAWAVGQPQKPEEASSALIVGDCDVEIVLWTGPDAARWFPVVLEFESTVDGRLLPDGLRETSVRLVRAASVEEARTRAEDLGAAERHSYQNEAGELVAWRLHAVEDVQPVDGDVADGVEVHSRLHRRVD